MKEYKIGYTQGVYDMFHVGHLNLLNQAKELCDCLIVGINSDALVQAYKNKTPIICENDRKKIVENIKAVDQCLITSTLDKIEMLEKIHFDVVFIGDDWKGNSRWEKTQEDLARYGVKVVYLKHTPNITSTLLRMQEKNNVDETGQM